MKGLSERRGETGRSSAAGSFARAATLTTGRGGEDSASFMGSAGRWSQELQRGESSSLGGGVHFLRGTSSGSFSGEQAFSYLASSSLLAKMFLPLPDDLRPGRSTDPPSAYCIRSIGILASRVCAWEGP